MRLKQQIKIKGKTWKITRQAEITDDGVACDGLTIFSRREILLSSSLKGAALQQTFLHEYIHACLHELHIDQLSVDAEDILADGLSSILVDSFKITWRKDEGTNNGSK